LNSSDTAYTGSIVNAAGGAYTISAAPEPSMWALMIAGVAMAGSLLRFSRKQQGALSVA
jgi:lysozyme family protein